MDDAIICNVYLAFHIDQFNNILYLLALAILWSGHVSSGIEFCLGSWPGCEVVTEKPFQGLTIYSLKESWMKDSKDMHLLLKAGQYLVKFVDDERRVIFLLWLKIGF